jgi:arylsulfatase
MLVLAGVILLGGLAFALLVEVHIPTRPVRSIEALREPREQPLNVVFILIDALRSDRLSGYGYERQTTPLLDIVTASGVRFLHVEAQSSWTKSSMASLWTGVFPHRTGVNRFNRAMPTNATMPAEIFKEAGYTTTGIWRNGWVAPNFRFNQGFDLYIRPARPKEKPGAVQRALRGSRQLPGTDLDIGSAAVEFLRTIGDEPFLLYLHYMDLHQYTYDELAADQGWGSSLSDSYDAALHWTDRNVVWVVNELEQLDILDRTLVVIASDHGEAFREHGIAGHARNLYREVTEVPLIFLLPFRLPEPLTVEPLVRNVDIWPTILDIVGLPPLEGADGRSLVPLMFASAQGESPKTPASLAYLDQAWAKMERDPSPLVSIRDPSRGRVAWNTEDPFGTLRVFDHHTDRDEQENLAPRPPEWTASLQRQLEEQLTLPLAWGEVEDVTVDEMYKAQLKALGYVVD